jgi:hypothetical protein
LRFTPSPTASRSPSPPAGTTFLAPGHPGDFDGDGDPDLVGATRIVRNTRFDGAAGGSRRQFAPGFAGSGGLAPTLGLRGPARPGSAAALTISGGVGGGSGLLVLGTAPAAIPVAGATLHVQPDALLPFVLDGAAGQPGSGDWTLDFGVLPPSLAGFSAWFQAGIVDAFAAQGLAATNPLEITVGL